ncbi:thiamine phosphate synthase [Sphingomonas sp. ID1715]|uniref:thiamine phosphate synthase n=1 Tax=Sphingomonas sp. ID1715 TaxID=1656898 RepID=UPI001488E1EE|nr:thiamine phosphate synthase [Sphingomonas sp. ID1715]NNM77304.1 thiamine phosphate synthase [Sphingomonas sp. ID1715]
MNRRHLALPRVWMLTDERHGEAPEALVARLPRDVGVVVRHYSLPLRERIALAKRLSRTGRFTVFAGSEAEARRAGADGVYGAARRPSRLPRLFPVHDGAEILRAERANAALLLLSPAFATRSHQGSRALGPVRFGLLARRTTRPIIALGGMNERRWRRLRPLGAQGWAAIDAWIRT